MALPKEATKARIIGTGGASARSELARNRHVKELDKAAKSGSTALFVVATVQLVFGIILGSMMEDKDAGQALIIASVALGVYFGALGFWARHSPLAALVVGLVSFVGLHVVNAVIDPMTIAQGLIMKVVVIYFLVKGVKAAMEAKKIRAGE